MAGLVSSGIGGGDEKSGTIKEVPPDVSQEKVAFLGAKAKELQMVADRWKKLTAELGLGAQSER